MYNKTESNSYLHKGKSAKIPKLLVALLKFSLPKRPLIDKPIVGLIAGLTGCWRVSIFGVTKTLLGVNSGKDLNSTVCY